MENNYTIFICEKVMYYYKFSTFNYFYECSMEILCENIMFTVSIKIRFMNQFQLLLLVVTLAVVLVIVFMLLFMRKFICNKSWYLSCSNYYQ